MFGPAGDDGSAGPTHSATVGADSSLEISVTSVSPVGRLSAKNDKGKVGEGAGGDERSIIQGCNLGSAVWGNLAGSTVRSLVR